MLDEHYVKCIYERMHFNNACQRQTCDDQAQRLPAATLVFFTYAGILLHGLRLHKTTISTMQARNFATNACQTNSCLGSWAKYVQWSHAHVSLPVAALVRVPVHSSVKLSSPVNLSKHHPNSCSRRIFYEIIACHFLVSSQACCVFLPHRL